MDRITTSPITDFLNQHEIKSESESNNFEKFCNYSIISKEYKKINLFCDNIINILNDPDNSLELFNNVLKIIDKSGIDINNQKLLYQKSNTDLLLSTYKSIYPKVKVGTETEEKPEAIELTRNSIISK
ncbi:MAG: hypothetical protein C3F06_06630 [Candidatus Methanoperedenaceae archaeon]|nr:MAG: hypothetical protein C3F06_06630 [Candidatus Methanoperedenaceae archaeon]